MHDVRGGAKGTVDVCKVGVAAEVYECDERSTDSAQLRCALC